MIGISQSLFFAITNHIFLGYVYRHETICSKAMGLERALWKISRGFEESCFGSCLQE